MSILRGACIFLALGVMSAAAHNPDCAAILQHPRLRQGQLRHLANAILVPNAIESFESAFSIRYRAVNYWENLRTQIEIALGPGSNRIEDLVSSPTHPQFIGFDSTLYRVALSDNWVTQALLGDKVIDAKLKPGRSFSVRTLLEVKAKDSSFYFNERTGEIAQVGLHAKTFQPLSTDIIFKLSSEDESDATFWIEMWRQRSRDLNSIRTSQRERALINDVTGHPWHEERRASRGYDVKLTLARKLSSEELSFLLGAVLDQKMP